MSDESEYIRVGHNEDDDGPDGVIVIHYPADGSEPYGVGPFPPVPDLVDAIILNGPCDCRKEPLPIVFPKGISIVLDPTVMAEDIARKILGGAAIGTVVILPRDMADALTEGMMRPEPDKKDRLN